MKKITLIIGLSFLSLAGYAQEKTEDVNDILIQERDPEYIIVIDDTKVEGNIDILLIGNALHDENFMGNDLHELAHNEPDTFSLEGKLVEGAFSYNDYAIHYKPETRVSVAAS
jgi:hypothetical protein